MALTPQDPSYRDHAPTFFRGGAPAVILQARHAEHVRSAVLLAAKHPDLPFSVRSGGHGVSGRSTNHGGIVLDLAAMNDIALPDPGTGLVRVEPGAQWLDVARTLQPHGLGISSGDYGGVGVGGLATAGGAGWLVREHGLTIDHVRAVEMVLADGSSVRADATTLPDLFWAVRGAGSNFGVVTAFEIAASPVSAVGYAEFVLVADDAARLLVDWGAALESAPRKVTSSVILGPTRPGQPVVAQVNTVVHSEQPDEIRELLAPFAAVGQLAQQSAQVVPYPHVIDNVYPGPHRGVGEPHARAAVVRHITPDLARGFAELLAGGEAFYFQIRALGGAVADVPADATAYAHRDANFLPGALGRSRDGMNREWDRLRPHFDGALRQLRVRRPAGPTGRGIPSGDPGPASRSQAQLRPAQPLPRQLQHRPRGGRGKRAHVMNEPITADLSGQTTVILGGTGNIGEGIVRAHIAAGATVVVPSRDADRIEVVRQALDGGADRLVGIEGDTQTFDGMSGIAEETVDRAGLPTHVVASIGGWYGGQPVWQTDEHAWNTYFVDPSRAHFAAARAFIPRMADGGSYTMILGLSAYLGMPATSPRAMHGGALRMLRQTLSTEVGPQRRVNSLAFAPLLSRARPHGDPTWLHSDHVGRLTLGLATTPMVTGQDFQVPTVADYTALMTSGFTAETDLGRLGIRVAG